MASKKENLKSLFSNTRSRVIIIFTILILFITVIVGFIKFKSASNLGPGATADVAHTPASIQSIPGSLNPTAQYVQLQEAQNVNQAKSALRKGGSAIPTIIQTQEIGEGVEVVTGKAAGGVGFTKLASEDEEGARHNLWIQNLKDANCSQTAMSKVLSQGASIADLRKSCSCLQLKNNGLSIQDLKTVCECEELKPLGFTARALKDIGFSAGELRRCQYSACEERAAGFSAKEMREAGYSAGELKGAGFPSNQIDKVFNLPPGIKEEEIVDAACQTIALKRLKMAGVTAKMIHDINGCSAAELKAAGFSLDELKQAGFSAKELAKAGFTAKELKDAGFSLKELKDAGFSAADLKAVGASLDEINALGYPSSELAGLAPPTPPVIPNSNMPVAPTIREPSNKTQAAFASNAQQLQSMMQKQNQQANDQRYQQRIMQRTAEMVSAATHSLQGQKGAAQVYVTGKVVEEHSTQSIVPSMNPSLVSGGGHRHANEERVAPPARTVIKTGDILFAVLDTSVNSDEPGPILATIVSGKLKGTKLIGSFNLPKNGGKMVISFNTMSVPGAMRTVSISAYAIDPNTARTALSSRTNNHYLYRYGALFASSFLEGFGNAFQSANTTVTIGGTGGGNNITVQNGLNRSTLQNAVIALATLGKSWGQVARQEFNIPTTVEVFSGTGLGILFTQDVTSI